MIVFYMFFTAINFGLFYYADKKKQGNFQKGTSIFLINYLIVSIFFIPFAFIFEALAIILTIINFIVFICALVNLEKSTRNIVTGPIKKINEMTDDEKVLPINFDSKYALSEKALLKQIVKDELLKAQIQDKHAIIESLLKKKKIINIAFSVLLFVFICLYFFHFPMYTYFIGSILLIVLFILNRKYNLNSYLYKEIKARPDEKISNIVMNTKNELVIDNSLKIFVFSLIVATICPLIIFSSPRIIYEKVDGGYAVRYYAFGIGNQTTVTIPETYKGEKVVSLRGNTFSNMVNLVEVNLPNTIKEIRGQAFKNCYSLSKVNIPNNLEYLGGGAFYNAISIEIIELPDTLTYLGGEAFYNATSLEHIKLSKNLTEIKGNTFENCYNLISIEIPDNVTRIGGHAFYGDTSLNEVLITSNSKLSEIGSSAFRRCTSLNTITIPQNTYVNERAFKESPTIVNRFGSSNDLINNNIEDDMSFLEITGNSSKALIKQYNIN